MSHPATRPEIVAALESNQLAIVACYSTLPDDVLFAGDPDHWGPAHHLVHLTRTSETITRGLRSGALPPHSTGCSRSYGEVIGVATTSLGATSRERLLEMGRVAVVEPDATRAGLIEAFTTASATLRDAAGTWSEPDLDRYAMRHPLIGEMTAREMLYFCVFHERHHLKLVRARLIPEA